jgi:cobalt-zinc-cadmium efflux system outer membrane protein
MIKRLSYMTLFAAASSCMAQTPLSLQQAVGQANRHRAELSAAASRVQAGEDLRRQAQARLNPRLFLQSEDLRVSNFDFSRDAETYAYVAQVVETSGARGARIGLATANARLSSLILERTRREIGFHVRDAYWQAAAAQFARTLFQLSDSYFQQVVQYHEARFREGKLAEVDLLRVQLQAQQIRAALANAQLEEQKAQLRLAREMGLADPGPWLLTEKFDDLEAPRMAGGLAEPQTELRVAKQEVAIAEAGVNMERVKNRPDLDFLFGYKRDLLLNTAIVGLQLNLPLFDRNRAGSAAAAADLESAKSTLEATEFQLSSDVAIAQREYESRLHQVKEVFAPLRERAEQIADVTRGAYTQGGLDLLRLIDAERLRVDSQLAWLDALNRYHLSVVELERAEGVEP